MGTLRRLFITPYPHSYSVAAQAEELGVVTITSAELPCIVSTAPPQFDGPRGNWSPETLLCASVADCFILTFRAVARAAHVEWLKLECRVEGVLDRLEKVSQFTRFTTFVKLSVPAGTDEAKARDLLERAEHGCLVANSLRGTRTLEAEVLVVEHVLV